MPASTDKPLYLDDSQPLERRIDDVIGRLTLEEKVGLLSHESAAIERLGIPSYNWWNECLHGVARAGKATVFPQAIGLAAAFDRDMMGRIATAISDEARAKYHEAVKRDARGIYQGLTFWTPTINIFRDPRWGRGQETYGEDPYLTAELGVSFVRGLQGDHPKYMKATSCAKHFAVHSGPESLRHTFDAQASPKDLEETYLPAFKALVDAGVESVMGAYNRTNGEPCCGSKFLLVDTLREKWGFQGHVVSDCWAIRDFHTEHKVTKTGAESAALALKMGCDLNCGVTYRESLLDALKEGLANETDVDKSLRRLFRARFKLGLFDAPEKVPFTQVSTDVVRCDAHVALAREAAQKSVVLLKNEGNILPLKDSLRHLFVFGPTASDVDVLLGSYFGLAPSFVTLLEGIVERTHEGQAVEYRKGCELTVPNLNPIDWISGTSADKDVSIGCFGISPLIEGEEGDATASDYTGDRRDIKLPAHQVELLKKCHAKGGKVVLVLTGGAAIDLSEVEPYVSAIVLAWYSGEQGGNGVADVLFGAVNPSGKLPVTFPKSLDDLPPFEDYSMKGRTYKYMEKEPLYPFGFGLSYTRFSYEALSLVPNGKGFTAKVTVKNVGAVAGDEVVQLYVTKRGASTSVPLSELIGFQRVTLAPGASQVVEIPVAATNLAVVNDAGQRVFEKLKLEFTAGGASPGARSIACGAPKPATANVEYG